MQPATSADRASARNRSPGPVTSTSPPRTTFQIAAAAPSDPAWQARWERAVASTGLPLHRMPSGAGHDAMKLHEVMPQAMLFLRGLHSGISHNPLESITNDDADLAVRATLSLLERLAAQPR